MYFGESSRHFHTRISEHRDISPRTNSSYAKTPNSNIYKHFLEKKNHAIDSSNSYIILSANDTSIKVAKNTLIHKLSRSHNGTMYFTHLFIVVNIFFIIITRL